MIDRQTKRLDPLLLVGLCLLPGLQTAVTIYLALWTPVTYPLLKAAIVAAPLLVWKFSGRRWRRLARDIGFTLPSVWRGLAGGAVFAGVILVGYYAVLVRYLDAGPMVAKARSLGILEGYWLAAAFISLGNSLMEEYFWRAFATDELRRRLGRRWQVCLAAGGLFGVHHAFALASAFPAWMVVLGTAGAAAAGAAWTFLRLRGWSIWDCYISHVAADLAIFWIGWDLIQKAGSMS